MPYDTPNEMTEWYINMQRLTAAAAQQQETNNASRNSTN